MEQRQAVRGFPSPSCRRRVFDTTWGGVRGGGTPNRRCWRIPPTLSLPHKGGGDAAARSVSSSRVGAAGERLRPFQGGRATPLPILVDGEGRCRYGTPTSHRPRAM